MRDIDAFDEVRLSFGLFLGQFWLTSYSYLDRINVSNARLAGMQSDLNMTDVEWSAGISLFCMALVPETKIAQS